MIYLFVLFSLIASSIGWASLTPAPSEHVVSTVSEIKSLSQISIDHPARTLFLLDLDDTTFDSTSMLGSQAWRRYIVEATKKIDPSRNWHDIFSYALAQKHPMRTVEPMTSAFVTDLQRRGYVVCGLTARERDRWYDTPQKGIDALTVAQLLSVNVHFDDGGLENTYPDFSHDPAYFQGTFFVDRDSKGEYLLHLFENSSSLPEKIVFIDDKPSQVKSVADALTKLGIPHECYIYSATEEKRKAFNPLIANIQLYHFYASAGQICLSDQEAAAIAQAHPDKNAEHYLRATLPLAKNQLN